MEWIAALIRTIGASFPYAASLVQLNSELGARNVNRRLDRLEDPISSLHPDIRNLSSEIYGALKTANSRRLEFEDAFYDRFGRPLATLEAFGAIKMNHALGRRHALGFFVISPYVLYMAALFESAQRMSKLVEAVDACKRGDQLDGNSVASQLGLPVPVVRAILELYRDKGFGLLSGVPGSNIYKAKV